MSATNSTVYDVNIRYAVEDKASDGLAHIGKNADRAGQSVGGLKDGLMQLAGLFAAKELFEAGKKNLVDFNMEIENAQISIAAVARMFGQEGSWGDAMKYSEGLFARYQDAAKASTATTKEFIDMHLSLGPTFAKFHASQKDIEDIVKGATVVAPILGERPETFAMDVKQMLQGSVTLRDRSAVSLLSMLGIDRESFNSRTKQDINYAIDVVKQALTSPAIAEAKKSFEGSFAGAKSTLEDTVQILAAQAGKPLFQQLTKEINNINDWMTAHPKEIEDFARKFSDSLMSGFAAVRDAVKFVVDNQDSLITIGKLWLAVKVAEIAAGAGSGLIGNVTKLAGQGAGLAGRFGGLLGIGGRSVATAATEAEALAAVEGLTAAEVAGTLTVGTFGAAVGTATIALLGLAGQTGILAEIGKDTETTGKEWREAHEALVRDELLLKEAEELRRQGKQGKSKEYVDQEMSGVAAMVKAYENASTNGMYDAGKFYNAIPRDVRNLATIDDDLQEVAKAIDTGFVSPKMRQDLAAALMKAIIGTALEGQIALPPGWDALDPNAMKDAVKEGKKANDKAVNVTIHRIEVAAPDPDRFAFNFNRAMARIAVNKTQAVDTLRGGA